MSRASVSGTPAFSNKNPSDAGQFINSKPRTSPEGRVARRLQEQVCNYSFNLPLFALVLTSGPEVVQRRMLEMAKTVIFVLSDLNETSPSCVTKDASRIQKKLS